MEDRMQTMRIDGCVALVTGARRGIGRAIALALAEAGADVAVSDAVIGDGLLDGVTQEITAMGRRSMAIQVDISWKEQVVKMARQAVRNLGRIDILVNCAGVWLPGQTLLECVEENWDKVIDTNLKGTFLCCQVVGQLMVAQRKGCIINISSQVGLNPGVGGGAYSVSKAGIIMLTRQLALELSSYGIRVNAIAPGVVMTDFNKDLWANPVMADQISGSIPLGRMATPEDIAHPALFLASDASAYMTGAILTVDGGWQVPGKGSEK
jgi:NAD(P)-dependent dehydrogenase (short-subunit alcohol dehydrogenase family)